MATQINGGIPTVKVESAVGGRVKDEPVDDDMLPYMDDQDDDGGDLDITNINKQIWLGHLPRNLWNVLYKLSSAGDDEEIEIGTVRTEGPETRPTRISLMLNKNLPQLANQHKEYNLFNTRTEQRRSKRAADTFVFSERDVQGYKAKQFNFDEFDEDGNPVQAASRLYMNHKRTQNDKKRKAEKELNPDAPAPPPRKIPKITAIQGIVGREITIRPVQNAEYVQIEALQTSNLLHQKQKAEAMHIKTIDGVINLDKTADNQAKIRDNAKKQNAANKKERKQKQYARWPKNDLLEKLHQLFAQYRIWSSNELKRQIPQSSSFLMEVLNEIAFQHRHGDWNTMWEMRPEYRNDNMPEFKSEGPIVAPEGEGDVTDDEDRVDAQ